MVWSFRWSQPMPVTLAFPRYVWQTHRPVGICHDVSTRFDTRALQELRKISRMGYCNSFVFPISIYHHQLGMTFHLQEIPGRVEPGCGIFSPGSLNRSNPFMSMPCGTTRFGENSQGGKLIFSIQKDSTNGFRVLGQVLMIGEYRWFILFQMVSWLGLMVSYFRYPVGKLLVTDACEPPTWFTDYFLTEAWWHLRSHTCHVCVLRVVLYDVAI